MTLAVERAELRGKDNWKAFVCVPSSNLELDIRRCAASGLAQLRRCFLFSRPDHSLVDTPALFLCDAKRAPGNRDSELLLM